jgi:hypothetical protein
MLTEELRRSREATIAAHVDGESRCDVDAVLATLHEYTYDLVTVGKVIQGKEEVGRFLQLMFDSLGPNTHHAEAFHHTEPCTIVEVLTVFPDGIDGSSPGEKVEVRSVGIFPFDGDRMLGERVYADMSPLLPFLD